MFKVESRNIFSDVKTNIRKYLSLKKKKRSYMKRVQNAKLSWFVVNFKLRYNLKFPSVNCVQRENFPDVSLALQPDIFMSQKTH